MSQRTYGHETSRGARGRTHQTQTVGLWIELDVFHYVSVDHPRFWMRTSPDEAAGRKLSDDNVPSQVQLLTLSDSPFIPILRCSAATGRPRYSPLLAKQTPAQNPTDVDVLWLNRI